MFGPSVVALAILLVAQVGHSLPPQKIVGGLDAVPGEFPYQVSIRSPYGPHICGGAIVSERHIITAAHCFTGVDPYSLTVATGTTLSSGGQIFYISNVAIHPLYQENYSNSPNDIAIITLASDIRFNQLQNRINLPSGPTPNGAVAVVTGWGYRSINYPKITRTLQKIQLPTVNPQQCQQMFGNKGTIFTTQICTMYGPGYGTCHGDSGGPLAYNNQLIGVVSYGIPCAQGLPDVFTSVYSHLSWIHQTLQSW